MKLLFTAYDNYKEVPTMVDSAHVVSATLDRVTDLNADTEKYKPAAALVLSTGEEIFVLWRDSLQDLATLLDQ